MWIENLKTSHEFLIDLVFPATQRSVRGGESPFASGGAAIAKVEEGQEIFLGSVASEGLVGTEGPQILVQNRTLADGVDPRAG